MRSQPGTIYIHGVGVIAAPGYGAAALLDACREGRAPSPTDEWPIEGHACATLGAVAGFDPARYVQLRGMRPLGRASRLGCVAAAAALGYPEPREVDRERCAVAVGTRWGSIEPLAEFDRSALQQGPHLVNPAQFPNVVVNCHAGYLGILFGLAGPNITLCGAGAGLEAIGFALDLLLAGRADEALAGGVEALGVTLLHGMARAGLLERPSPPGEGAALLRLSTRPPSARAVRVAGYAEAGADLEALGVALSAAGIAPREVRAVWPTGDTSTAWEAAGLSRAGRYRVEQAAGDCQAASSALAAAAAAELVARGGGPALVLAGSELGHCALVLA